MYRRNGTKCAFFANVIEMLKLFKLLFNNFLKYFIFNAIKKFTDNYEVIP